MSPRLFMFIIIVYTTVLLLFLSHFARSDQSTDAINTAAKALYYQEHFDEWTKYSKREYVDKNFSKSTQETTALFYLYLQMLQDHKLTYRWEFP